MISSFIPNINKHSFTDEDIISGINNNEDWAINTLIRAQYTPIKKMVFSLRNTLLEPDDIFQEGLMRLIVNIRAGRFKNESSLSTYLNRICRNICLKILTNHKTTTIEGREIIDEIEDDDYYDLLVLISEIKEKTEKSCREILDLRFKQSDEGKKLSAINYLVLMRLRLN